MARKFQLSDERAENKVRNHKWRQWVEMNCTNVASIMHEMTQLSTQWSPEFVTNAKGQTSAAPADFAEAQRGERPLVISMARAEQRALVV